ncbi:MAG: methyltransferase domain-containing protein, partial [Holophaga sp.]|nr:methyltransferase domain-containing protein [Holophaga sp.]
MVKNQIEARGVDDPRVLEAMATLPRHRFVDAAQEASAYEDHPLPIGWGQTISQPYIVAFMAEALALSGTEKVLEVGCGCGYMAAVLAKLSHRVFGIDLEPDLVRRAQAALEDLGIANAALRCGDGKLGMTSAAQLTTIASKGASDLHPSL